MQLSTYLNSLMNFYNTWFMKSIMCHLGNCLQNYPSIADLNEMRLDSKCGLRTHKSSSYDVNWYEKAVPCYKMVFDLICTEIVSGSKSWRMRIRQLRAAILLWIINSEIFFCIIKPKICGIPLSKEVFARTIFCKFFKWFTFWLRKQSVDLDCSFNQRYDSWISRPDLGFHRFFQVKTLDLQIKK